MMNQCHAIATSIQVTSLDIDQLQDTRPFNEYQDEDELTVFPAASTSDTLQIPTPSLSRTPSSSSSLRTPSPSLSTTSSSSSLKRARSPTPPADSSPYNHGQSHANNRRRQKRQARKNQNKGAYSTALEKHVFNSEALSSTCNVEAVDRPFDSSTLRDWAHRQFKHQDLVELDFTIVPWDSKKSMAIYDSKGKLLVVLAGQPEDHGYVLAAAEVHSLLMELGEEYRKLDKGKGKGQNRRGDFDCINFGLTHGNGTTEPVNLKVKPKFQPIVDRLRSDKSVRRLAGNASAVLNAWAPEYHCVVEGAVRGVMERDPKLWKPFEGSVYPTCAFNFGPNAWCYIHRDSLNVTNGYCAIQAMGTYDHTVGGHLVLWDLKKVLQFPPGSTVLIMSSLLFHSSLAVGPGEERSVMTQYCPEGLVRYVNNGMKTDKEMCEGMTDEERKEFLKNLRKERKEGGLKTVPEKDL